MVNNYAKEPISRPTGGTLQPESLKRVYNRHRSGALVRSVASVFMWVFALISYSCLAYIDRFSIIGISVSVLFLILINLPTLWILKKIRQKKIIVGLSMTIHGLEIICYTSIIYFVGGLGRGYLIILYPAVIVYVGVMSPRYWAFIISIWCSLCLSGMIALESVGLIPDTTLSLRNAYPYSEQLFDVVIFTGGLMIIAFITSYTSGLLRRSRAQLKKQNTELKETGDELEQTRLTLVEKNMSLEEAIKMARTSDQKKSEFLANMSHELRTPLNHIIGFTELVIDKTVGPLNTNQEEFLNDVLGSSRHLLSLINDILDLSKVEAGKMELETWEFPLETTLENSLNMVKEKALKHKITLALKIYEIPATIHADERKLKQILYNLLSNAVKFTPEGGEVEMEAQGLNGQGIEITIRDTGIGMTETDLERIFQPFEQGDNSATRKYQGTGLGLSLTKLLVELHGGRIWAESRGVGAGSSFTFMLPCQNQALDSLNRA
jgi:signal transduction histidine kinase